MTRFSPELYAQLRVMREQVARGEFIRPGNGRMAAVMVREGLIQSYWDAYARDKRWQFTPHGWLYANTERLWDLPSRRGDLHTLARHWK